MALKHLPGLRDVIPFGDDPYDAVGSFAGIVAVLVGLFSVGLAWGLFRQRSEEALRQLFLLRTRATVACLIAATVMTDAIAMARHPNGWTHSPIALELLLLLAAMLAAALVAFPTGKAAGFRLGAISLKTIVAVFAAAAAIAVYPKELIAAIVPHIATILVAAALLFAPVRLVVLDLVPFEEPIGERTIWSRKHALGVVSAGIAVGLFAFFAELSEGPMQRFWLVLGVFVATSLAGMLIAYACLASPLGL